MPDPFEEKVKRLSPSDLDIFKKQLPQRLKEMSPELRTTAMEKLRGLQLLDTPSPETPLWQKGLQTFGAPFQWIQEKAIEPFAAVATSPFTPTTKGTQNQDWFQRELSEYKAWEDPAIRIPGTEWDVGVKGVVESLPWFALPTIGTVGKVGMAGRGIAGALGKLGTAGKVAGAAVEYSPWGLAEKATGKALTTAAKGVKSLAGPVVEDAMAKTGWALPSDDLLNKAYKQDNVRKFAQWAEDKPIVSNVMRAIGGEAIFVKGESQLPQDIVQRAIVNRARLQNIGVNLQGAEMPRLTRFGDAQKVLQISEDGIVNTAKPKSGQSRYLNDILENPDAYNWSTPQAEQYMQEFARIRKDLKGLLEANGLKQSDKVHRIVKGIQTEDGRVIESKFGSDPSLSRIYETQEESALAHLQKGQKIVYGVNPNEIMQYEFDRTINRIARKRFADTVKPLGKTAIERFNEIYPEKASQIEQYMSRINAAKSTLDVVQRILSYKATSIPGATLAKIKRDFPEIGGRVSVLFELAPPKVEKVISKMGREMRSALKTNPKELKDAIKTISDVQTTWRGQSKITMMDIEDAINNLNLDAQMKAKLIETGYKETAKANREFFKQFMTANRDYLVKAIDETKTAAAPLRQERYKFLQGYAGRERLPHKAGEVTERPFNMIPEFRNKFFPDEIVTYLERTYSDEGTKWVRTMGNIGAMSRSLTAVLDDSAPFIQGLFVFGRDPVAWARATVKQLDFFVDPKNFDKYMVRPDIQALHAEMAKYGSTIAPFEMVEAIPQVEKLVAKIPKAGETIKKGVQATYGRAEAAFTGFGQVSRDNLWKVLRTSKMTEPELQELARSIDLMTGNLSTKAMVIPQTQRDIESAWVFYSPRFTRASLAFIADMFKGGISGDQARKSVAGLMASGAAMYLGISRALGQEPNFDPRSGKFMTIKVGDDHIGVGGMLYSLARLGGNLATVDNPTDLLKMDRFDNPFVKFMYGKSAPFTGMVVGALEQKDYMGRPFESPADWGKFLAEKVTPFSVQPLWEQPNVAPASMVAQFGGLRQFPKSPSELRTEARETQATKTFGTDYASLTKADQNRINQAPEITKLTEQMRKEGRDTPENIAWDNFNQEGDDVENSYRKEVTLASKEFEKTGDGSRFRDKIDTAKANRRYAYSIRAQQPQYATIQAYFNTPKTPEAQAKMHPLDVAREEYYRFMYSPDMYDEFGNYRFDEADRREGLFAQQYGQQALDYVQDYSTSKWDEPTAMKVLKKARSVLQPYWEIENQIWSNYPPELKQIAGQIDNLPDERQQKMVLFRYPQIVMARRLIALYRKHLKLRNPQIAQALQTFYQ